MPSSSPTTHSSATPISELIHDHNEILPDEHTQNQKQREEEREQEEQELPPHPTHNLHSSYSMPSFSNPVHRPYLGLNPIAASARTSFTRVDVGDDEEAVRDTDEVREDGMVQGQEATTDAHAHDEKPHVEETKEEEGAANPSATSDFPQQSSQSPSQPSQAQPAPTPAPEPPVPSMPQVHLTFLFISSRRRTMAFEPETTVGRVKELIWNSWPDDWQDERPPAPAYLRVLYLGKMLQDDDTLTKLKFPIHTPAPDTVPTPTIVHISIRPSPPPGESDAMKKPRVRVRWSNADPAAANGDDANAGGCCGCVIC